MGIGFLLGFLKSGKFWLYLILSGALAAGGWGIYSHYTGLIEQVNDLNKELVKERTARKQTTESIKFIRQDIEESKKELKIVRDKARQNAREANELRQVLSNHDLNYLAVNKPLMIERRVNEATEEVFKDLEELSKHEED